MSIPRFLKSSFPNFEIIDLKEWLQEGRIEVFLESNNEGNRTCNRCGTVLQCQNQGKYRVRLEGMPILGLRHFIHFWRSRGYCSSCKKIRAERIDWIAQETPHLTQEYAWWLGRLCEIAPVSRVAEMFSRDETTLWRLDLSRMKRMMSFYKIPEVTAISVDEVYARKKPKHPDESRDERFFTIISDLKTRKVIWVSESRAKAALDQFFILLGKKACSKIKVVASDQHDAYAASVREHVPQAIHVLDRFHLMQNFEKAVNDTRIDLHEEQEKGSEMKRLTLGRYRFLFLKKASRRTQQERIHIDDVLKENAGFAKLELIKERMLNFFEQQTEEEAFKIFEEIGDWIWQCRFTPLMKWYKEFELNWNQIKNYFQYRVTSALSEGINNVIKMLKRRAFGYRNMEYFRLKILQVCGYLNSRFIPTVNSMT